MRGTIRKSPPPHSAFGSPHPGASPLDVFEVLAERYSALSLENSAWQEDLFAVALAEIATVPDLINQVPEVTAQADGQMVIELYELPAASAP